MDIVDIDYIRPWLIKTPIYRDSFYRIIFVTDGEEEISVNRHKMIVNQGNVICSRPGEIWEWQQDSNTLRGYVLLFEEDFLLSFFNDPLFIERLPYLRTPRSSPFLQLNETLREQLWHLFILTKEEISKKNSIDPHFLRAMLYGSLILLSRAKSIIIDNEPINEIPIDRYIDQFTRLVNENFMKEHQIEFYADKLCITSNYLNKIVKSSLGTKTKLHIEEKIITEAKKLLKYTSLSIKEIADLLNFNTTSYFIRFFRRYTNLTPLQFRKENIPEK